MCKVALGSQRSDIWKLTADHVVCSWAKSPSFKGIYPAYLCFSQAATSFLLRSQAQSPHQPHEPLFLCLFSQWHVETLLLIH